MKRKLTTLLLAMLLLICTVAGLTACDIDTGAGKCEHSYSEWTEKTAPTCTESGEETRTCDKCGNVETRSIDALGHDFSEEWTTDENGHWHACKNAGCTAKSDEAEHSDRDHYCRYCDYKTSEHEYTLIEYSWTGNDYCQAVRTCDKCSADAKGHDEKAIATITSTITQNKTCTLPELTKYTANFDVEWAQTQIKENVETDSALGHEYTETGTTDENGHYHVCTHENCGEKSTYAEIDKNNDYACDICGEGLSLKLETDVAALVGDGTKDCVDVSLNLHKNADSSIFGAIIRGLANATDGSINLTLGGAETIPSFAFEYCNKLKTVTFGDGVKTIGYYAFYECENLLVVTLGANVESIGDYAFSGCNKLLEVVNNSSLAIEAGSYNYGYVAYNAKSVHSGGSQLKEFNGYLVITAEDGDMLVGYVGSETELVLPNKFVKDTYTIASSAFEYSDITSITIPASVAAIGEKTFYSARSLTTVTFAKNCQVEKIGDYAFYGCYALTSIVIPSSVKTIGKCAFAYCSAMTAVTFAENCQVEKIDSMAFCGCYALASIVIPSSVKTIGDNAFENCSKLATVTFAENCQIEKIPDSAFRGCCALKAIVIPSSVQTIGKNAFAPAQYNGTAMGLQSVTFETGSKLTLIDEEAFSECKSLVSFVCPDSVTTINGYAFYECENLMTVTLGKNLTTIEDGAFTGCENLLEVVNNSSLEIVAGNLDYGNVAYYAQSVHGGESQVRIQDGYVAICADDGDTLVAYLGSDTELTLPNKFVKDTYTIASSAFEYSDITSITIPASVTSIGAKAFYSASSLTTVIFKENSKLSYIGEEAFYNCSNLKSIAISANGVEIGKMAFYNCSELTTITDENGKIGSVGASTFYFCKKLTSIAFSSETKEIGNCAFGWCSALTTVTFDENCLLETIGEYAFNYSGITQITIPSKVTSIGTYAFGNCEQLTTVTFESGSRLTSIENGTFSSCENLSTIVIPYTVTTIGENAFAWSGLTSVTFETGSELSSIEDYAFNYCKELTSITFGGTTEQWNNVTFGKYWKTSVPATEVVCSDGKVSL